MNKDSHPFKTLAEQYPEFVKNPHSWAAMVERYRDDVVSGGGSAQMLRLVEYLAVQEYASFFCPGASLMGLCISTEPYPRNLPDSLVVSFDNALKLYRLDYYEAGSMKPEKRMCGESEVRHVVELKLLRIKLAAGGAAA